jgi:hypothetical protein
MATNPPKFTQIGTFGLKLKRLATLGVGDKKVMRG